MTFHPATYEERMYWYRLACAAVFAIPVLTFLTLPSVSPGLSQHGELEYLVVQSLLAACLGLLAARVRDAMGEEESAEVQLRPAIRTNLQEIGKRGMQLSDLGDALRRNEGSDREQSSSPARPLPEGNAGKTPASNINRFDNSHLAKRLELESARLRTVSLRTTERHAPVPLPIEHEEVAEPAAPLSKDDVQALFRALLKGTTQHLGRAPSTQDLARLVRTWPEISNSEAALAAAHGGTVSIHWSDQHWVMEFRASCDAST